MKRYIIKVFSESKNIFHCKLNVIIKLQMWLLNYTYEFLENNFEPAIINKFNYYKFNYSLQNFDLLLLRSISLAL